MTCEGSDFPRSSVGGGINLRQTGFTGPLGPEFAFSAVIKFDLPKRASILFDFANDNQESSIFVEVGGPDKLGTLIFGIVQDGETISLPIDKCWEPNATPQTYLFTISATGTYNVYRDGELIAKAQGKIPRCCFRRHLFVGQSSHAKTESFFSGRVQKVKVWDQEVDHLATDMMYASEIDSALSNFAQWYMGEMAVWTFGSLASYASAVEKDKRFAADLLLKLDVHDELDGYDDFVCQALSSDGLTLTLGGPGRSWSRSGGGWIPVDTSCSILDAAEAKSQMPWAFMGAFPGDQERLYFSEACPVQKADCAQSRRAPRQRRLSCNASASRRHFRAASKKARSAQRSSTRWKTYGGLSHDEISHHLEQLVPSDRPSLSDLLLELGSDTGTAGLTSTLLADLEALDAAHVVGQECAEDRESDDDLPGLVIFNRPKK
eukprot:TRINITY_DN79655_c0_g1_i1.p1 TRINITY_DN79655_c0_g1~~TRINITY_DN79655_c0_g1_i1.p1  ORF type:complete len:479 (-),score=86.72 TRINITY_DN79655_c0_g1_i1:114-1415(-)